ncbi:MAG TPA: hypothetical protein VGL39_01580 [Jatrophihabitantaceae bacterium]|jgi:hypothetical protein
MLRAIGDDECVGVATCGVRAALDDRQAPADQIIRVQRPRPSDRMHDSHGVTCAHMCEDFSNTCAHLMEMDVAEVGDDEPVSRAALARRAGVCSTTLLNWTRVADRPLVPTMVGSDATMYTWDALLRFCNDHPAMPAAQVVRRRVSSRPPSAGTGGDEDEPTLRAALRDMKTAVDAGIAAVARSAALAREVASAHEDIVGQLRVIVRAYDSAMTSATAPTHGPA